MDNIARVISVSELYSCEELKRDVSELLGEDNYTSIDALAVGFSLALCNNYAFDLNSKGDLLLHNVTNSTYDLKSITMSDVSSIRKKRVDYKEVLTALCLHGSKQKYISYIAWNMKYCDVVIKCLEFYNKFTLSNDASKASFINRVAFIILEEFGYINTQVLLHVIVQLTGANYEDNLLVGHVLAEDCKCSSVTLASAGSVVTKDLQSVIHVLNLDKIKIRPVKEEVQHLVSMPVLGSMEMRLLRLLPYRDKLAILTRRIKYLCEHPELKYYVDTVHDLGDYEWKHAMNVALLAGLIAIEMQVKPRTLNHILLGAVLHDIGKSKVPETILTASRKLTPEELKEIRQHPTYGAELLKGMAKPIVQIAEYHHACNDGWGYPEVKEIPKVAAIVHIVDVYDAMCRERDYKKPYDRNFVRKYINNNANWFDEEVLTAFNESIKIFMPGETAFISGTPCTFFDFKDNKYVFFAEALNQFIYYTEPEIRERLVWHSSMEV